MLKNEFFHLDFQFIKYLNSISLRLFEEGNSLAVQWLGLRALTAEGLGSMPGQGSINKIPQAVRHSKEKKSLFEEDSQTISVRWRTYVEVSNLKYTLEVAHQWPMGTPQTTDP